MISYGSQSHGTAMSHLVRSHQLGEGQSINTGMSGVVHPSRLVYGSQILIAETLCGKRSHQLGKGHVTITEMSQERHPSQPVYGSQQDCTAMSPCDRSQGKGQFYLAVVPKTIHPSRPVYGSHLNIAAMLRSARSHLFTRGQTSFAEMPRITRLSREGSPRTRRNATETTPFPTSFGPPPLRRKATPPSPNFNQRPNRVRRNAFYRTPRNQGDPIWIQDMKTRLSHK